MARPVRSLIVLLALAAAGVTGCTATPGTPSTSTTATTGQTSTSAATSSTEPPPTTPGTVTGTPVGPPVRSLHAGDTDQGRTITMHVGDELTVDLTNTYWRFDDPAPTSALRAVGPPSVRGLPTPQRCVPGGGCGTVEATYRAVAAGTTVVAANRTVCGEALACTGAQAHYRLTVVVN